METTTYGLGFREITLVTESQTEKHENGMDTGLCKVGFDRVATLGLSHRI